MKANELRIGNYVSTHNESLVIVDAINKIYIHSNKGVFVKEVISPIPLTEEWLLKLGYVYSPSCHYWIKGHLIWKPSYMLVCDKNGIVIKYVHQLQNLYFALTGEELTLKSIF